MLTVDKERFDEHLPYEIDMLCATYAQIARIPGWVTSQVTENALIESFCIHARALFEFFKEESISHIYTTASYAHRGSHDRFRKELNNQIAHLIHDLRTKEPAGKIGSNTRFDMLEAARIELEEFKRHLKSEWDASRLHDVPAYIAVPAMPSATNAIQTSSASFNARPPEPAVFTLIIPSSMT